MINHDANKAVRLAPIRDIRKGFLSGLKLAVQGLDRDIKESSYAGVKTEKRRPLHFFTSYCVEISSSLTDSAIQRLVSSILTRKTASHETCVEVYLDLIEEVVAKPPTSARNLECCLSVTRIVFCSLWAEGLIVLPRRISCFKTRSTEMREIAQEKAPSNLLYKVMAVNAESGMEFSGPVRGKIRSIVTSHWVRLLWSTNWNHPKNITPEDIRELIKDASALGKARFYPIEFMRYLFSDNENLLTTYYIILAEIEDKRLAKKNEKSKKRKAKFSKGGEYRIKEREKKRSAIKGTSANDRAGIAWIKTQKQKDSLIAFAEGRSDQTLEALVDENFTPTGVRQLFYEPDLVTKTHFLYSELGEREQSLVKLIDTTFKGFIQSKAIQKTSQHEYVLVLLLSYVSIYLPHFFRERDGSLEKFPTTFNEFTCAYYIANNYYIASLINQNKEAPITFFKYLEVIGKKFNWSWNETAYAHLKTAQGYFEYIESLAAAIPNGDKFKSTITDSNLPRTRRRVTTVKNVLPREHFRVFIALLETLDYLVDHINGMADGENPGVIGGRLILATYSELIYHGAWSSLFGSFGSRQSDIEVECLNYTPVILYEGRYFPLRRIKRFYTLTPYRVNGVDETRATPHVPRVMWLMANTGIRQKHLLWLNKDEFDSAIQSKISALSPLIVSTDKSHSEWVSIVSGEVIKVCQRQKKWLERNEIESLKEPMWYSDDEKNRFGQFIPLFRLDASHSTWGIWEDSAKIMWTLDRFLREEVGEDDFSELAYWEPTKKSKIPNSLKDYRQTLDQFSKAEIDLSWGWKLRSKYTPHGLRAAFVSSHIRFLPPSVIGRHLTGQVEALVWYYNVMDAKDIGDHEQLLINLLMRNEESIRNGDAPELSQKIIEINVKLAKDIEKDPGVAIAAHGLFSLSDVAESENGIAALKARRHTQLAFNSTHICPFGNICPAEVVDRFGLNKPCTLCPYAIRGSMHLPAINAEKFRYIEMMEDCGERLKDYKKRTKTAVIKADIEELESQYDLLIRDAFALEAIEQQLHHLRAADTESFMAEDTESIKELYSNLKLSESEYLIKRLVDVQCFPNLDSPSLQRRFAHLRLKLQMADGDLTGVLASHKEPEHALLTSQILSMMSSRGLSVKEIFQIASSDLPSKMEINPAIQALGFDKLVDQGGGGFE
jgi:hypothetical protein